MNKNWLPLSRQGQLSMAKQWQPVITAKATAWNIPAAEATAFGSLITAADAALKKVQDKATRTHIDTVACNEAFDELTAKMRFIKNNYFNSPPRTAADLASLNLSKRDKSSDVPPPQNQVTAKYASMRYQFRKAKLCWEWRNILVALAGGGCTSYNTSVPAARQGRRATTRIAMFSRERKLDSARTRSSPALVAAKRKCSTLTAQTEARRCIFACGWKTLKGRLAPGDRFWTRLYHRGGYGHVFVHSKCVHGRTRLSV